FPSGLGLFHCVLSVFQYPLSMLTAAVLVVAITTHIGISVTQRYRPRPSLTRYADTIASASAASIWLAMPNMAQMAAKLLALMKYAQPITTSSVLAMAPGHQPVWPSLGWSFPAASCKRKRPMRVP